MPDEGEGEDDTETGTEIGVWPCNLLSVRVFQVCRIDVVGAGLGVTYNGISSAEIRSAFENLQVPHELRADITEDVQLMGRAASRGINDRIAARTASKRR